MLGAALYAANLSTTFRLRKCGMTDGVTHPVTYQVEAAEDGCALKPHCTLCLEVPAPQASTWRAVPAERHKPQAAQLGWSTSLQYACVRAVCHCKWTSVKRWHLLSVHCLPERFRAG